MENNIEYRYFWNNPKNNQIKINNMENGEQDTTVHQLTFGQKAVGITFNPSNNGDVDRCKQMFANCIDQMDAFRNRENATAGQKRHASTAITMLEDAQMRAVKALTWKD